MSEELAVIPEAPVSLFRTDEPTEIIERATVVANSLAGVVKKQQLATRIQGRDHVRVEGWTLLGTLLGVFPVLVWSRELENPPGYEARVEARTKDGAVVGAAEAQCDRSEATWAKRDNYALRSMAQTRATSKALRQPLGFVMSLAGFAETPAEEMPAVPDGYVAAPEWDADPRPVLAQAPTPAVIDLASAAQVRLVKSMLKKLENAGKLTPDRANQQLVVQYGTEDVAQLSKRDASDLIDRLQKRIDEVTA